MWKKKRKGDVFILTSKVSVTFNLSVHDVDFYEIQNMCKSEHEKLLAGYSETVRQKVIDIGYDIDSITINY